MINHKRHCGLAALVIAAAFSGLAAQNPPAAPAPAAPTAHPDSMARVQVLNEVFPEGTSAIAPRVTLQQGVVYRVEIQPAVATVTIRSARHPSLPPLLLVPLEGGGPPGASQTDEYLVVPLSREEYRIDVTDYGVEPVRVRVQTDPRETSRWARIQQMSKGQPAAGFSLRAVYFGAFATPNNAWFSQPPGTASATGVEGCLAVVPRGQWIEAAFGGCVLAIARYARPNGAGLVWYLGTEPGLVVTGRHAPVETSVVLTVGLGTATGASQVDYSVVGLGVQVAVRTGILGGHLWPEVQIGFSSVHVVTYGYAGKTNVVPRVAAGLELRF